jgi:repressor LexA
MQEILLSNKESEAVRHIRNSIIHKGKFPSVRELMTELDYRSPRSAAVIIEKLLKKRIVRKKADGNLQLIKDFGRRKY